MRLTKFIFAIAWIAAVTSCKKDKPEDPVVPDTLKNGMLVLNEGLFQLNNSTLSWVDFGSGKVSNEFFIEKNGRLLGDTGNDMERYGGKIYIVVNVSSTIEVLDASTGKSVKQIPMMNGNVSKQPRSIAFFGNKAFISCFDGFVDVLDTASLEITQRIQVGLNPESLTISGQKLFVSNSGGLNSPEMDSTVSVIDVNSFTEISKIKVGKNPGSIVTDYQGDVYVVARGNYSNIPSRMKKINTTTLTVENSFPFEAGGLEVMGNKILISYSSAGASHIALFNAETDLIENPSYIAISNIETLYGMHYRSSNQHIYLVDAKGYTNTGYIREYSNSGNFITSYHVGLNPNSILFYE